MTYLIRCLEGEFQEGYDALKLTFREDIVFRVDNLGDAMHTMKIKNISSALVKGSNSSRDAHD